MKKLILIVASIFCLLSFGATAHSYKQGDIAIGHIWARATAVGATTAAIYFPLLNNGKEPDKLVGASTEIADKVLIHESLSENGIKKMVSHDSVVLEPNKPVSFRPNGLHLMLVGLKQQLEVGGVVPIILNFEKAGAIKVEARIESSK